MKKHSVIFRRIFTVLLTALMLVVMFIPLTADAAKPQKPEHSYEIAVVLDNSGSMYVSEAWCRAKYAMEIFASMLNYERGDKLAIFPMWEAVYDKNTPIGQASFSPLIITGRDGIDKISNMGTTNPSGTPFEPVYDAHDYLKKSGADEKWIIVLTDGAFNCRYRSDQNELDSSFRLDKELEALCTDNIKIQYLGFDQADNLKSNESIGFYSKKSTDTSLKDDLVEICNRIFERERLPENRLSGKTLKLDISMSKLIVFVQGDGAKVNSLTSADGTQIQPTMDSKQRKYSEISIVDDSILNYFIEKNEIDPPPADKTLAGQVVTFSDCPKGEYTLDYVGDNNIQIFYEPNVSVKVVLTDSEGTDVDFSSGDIVPGEYTVTSTLVDASTNEDLTGNELLGNVSFKTYVKRSDESSPTEYQNGAKINFEPDSKTEVYIEGTFLDDYTISTKDDPSAFPLSFKVSYGNLVFALSAKVLQEQSWYRLKDHESWKPVEVSVTIGGQPATKEQIDRVQLNVTASDTVAYRIEKVPEESKFRIYIGCDDSGNYVKPEVGSYSLSFDGSTYTDEVGDVHTANKTDVSFKVQSYSRFLIWIIIFIVIAVLFLIWLAFMKQKVMPNKIIKDSASFWSMNSGAVGAAFVTVKYNRKQRTLTLDGPSSVPFKQQISVTFKLKPVDNRFTKPNKRRVAVIGISSSADEINIGATTYVKYNGQWMKESFVESAEHGKPIPSIEKALSVGPSFEVYNSPNGSNVSNLMCHCKTKK